MHLCTGGPGTTNDAGPLHEQAQPVPAPHQVGSSLFSQHVATLTENWARSSQAPAGPSFQAAEQAGRIVLPSLTARPLGHFADERLDGDPLGDAETNEFDMDDDENCYATPPEDRPQTFWPQM